uniref:TPR_REGION domain-containing protein n=1 Tax=Mesocestoides corti TaxID=53468 RepID=A0A5K3EZ24_MESCO
MSHSAAPAVRALRGLAPNRCLGGASANRQSCRRVRLPRLLLGAGFTLRAEQNR